MLDLARVGMIKLEKRARLFMETLSHDSKYHILAK